MESIPRTGWIHLYKQLLRSASQFPQYNYREFFKRRIRDHFTAAVKNNNVSQTEFYEVSIITICKMRECPKCKAKKYSNQTMVMMINECGHPLCRNCVENLFARNSGPCPQCGKILWKKGFWEQIFDDPMVEKENHIRKKLKKIYNLKRADFPTLRDFNNYLERIETIVMNLTYNIDVEETETEINRFKAENSELIERNKRKLDEDQIWVLQMLEEEQKRKKHCIESTGDEEELSGKVISSNKSKAIIDELRESDLPAEVILDRQRKRQIEAELAEKEEAARRKKSKMEAQQKRLDTTSFASVRISGAPFVYHAPELPINGPSLPNPEDLSRLGYLQHVLHISGNRHAGGFTPETCCMRALFDSRIDLFLL
uniref:RING-type domain-containing protein n=1 Tax=Onchocerca volvulus TaxID=6282 RepID=A0A8R1XNW6_ONCVO